jgi:MHS family proline/betaine transporter-like MFS transporter
VGAYTLVPLLFDKASRYTGVAMGWNLGVIVAGGSAPYLAVWLIERTGNNLAPAFVVIVVALIGLAALFSIRRGSLHRVESLHDLDEAQALEHL